MLDQSKTYTYDSRKITAGDAFICLPKGEAYIESALTNGASEVVRLSRESFAAEANAYFDYPTKRVTLIGITGTNGKTSVAAFTTQLLTAMGHHVLMIGTLNSELTTPECWDTLERIKRHADNGGTHVVLEVSSHGIDQHRVDGFDFNIKCLTNITQDHLDYHHTFENYKQTKLSFMADSPGGAIYSDDIPLIEPDQIPQLMGSFHLKNVSTAIQICLRLGENQSELMKHLYKLVAPEGRFESLNVGQTFDVIIDFAHTPDALAHVLTDALRQVSGDPSRIRLVMGCGGDRDQSKRKKMGRIAEESSRNIYLTADNSRSELTTTIIEDILSGMKMAHQKPIIQLNRWQAISAAIKDATPNDLILIVGKGHETMQHCHGFSYEFNDANVAYSELICQGHAKSLPKWSLNQSSTKADVVFISKQKSPQLKVNTSQFKRILKTPTFSKITQYLKKIKGPKVVVFESGQRTSIAQAITRALALSGQCVNVTFNHNESMAYNLTGLTLIDQTEDPIIIQVPIVEADKLVQLLRVISPDHIIVGDIYTPNGCVDPHFLKSMERYVSSNNGPWALWYSSQMTDLDDHLEGVSHGDINVVNASSWVTYMDTVIQSICTRFNRRVHGQTFNVMNWLMGRQWCIKVSLEGIQTPLYVLEWGKDTVDADQKNQCFQQNAQAIINYVAVQGGVSELLNELKFNNIGIPSKIHVLDHQKNILSDVSRLIKASPQAVHLLWIEGIDFHELLEKER